jgi:hypothetical protein
MEQNPSWGASNSLASQEIYPPFTKYEDPFMSLGGGGVHHRAVS